MPTITQPYTQPAVSSRDKAASRFGGAKKKISPLSIIAGLGIAVLCLSALWRYTHGSTNQGMLKMVAAARDLPAGVSVGLMDLRYIEIPREIVTRDMTGSLNDVVGRDARTYIPAGEPIRRNMVFAAAGGLSRNIAPDERAITLQLNDDTLVDHAIKPDDRVDVLVISSKDAGKFTKTICQLARVLIVAPKEQMLARHLGASAMNKITLGVKPEVAEQITEAAEVGKIRLVLRPKVSVVEDMLQGASPDDLLPRAAFTHALASSAVPPPPGDSGRSSSALPPPPSAKDAPPPPPASPIEWLVQVFAGTHREILSVPEK